MTVEMVLTMIVLAFVIILFIFEWVRVDVVALGVVVFIAGIIVFLLVA